MWNIYLQPISIDEVLFHLQQNHANARIINGGTDLILEIEKKVRQPQVLIDISRIEGLDNIWLENNRINIGAGVTHNQAAASELLRQKAYPLVCACSEVGAPQIRNRGTIAGNILTASPANDTIPALIALGAEITLRSVAREERSMLLADFIQGVRKTLLEPDEILLKISFPAMLDNEKGAYLKYGLRQAQAISVVNTAVILGFESKKVISAKILLGSVASKIVFAKEAQAFLIGKHLDENVISKAAELARDSASPIGDVRGSADYRFSLIQTLVKRLLQQIRDDSLPGDSIRPAKLWGKTNGRFPVMQTSWDSRKNGTIETTVNGKQYSIQGAQNKTLLRMIREDIGLTGTKEGCSEGECGACTILLDGIAVMGCMVPAPRAHQANIVTIEGLATNKGLHPVQQAFIDTGAVQCGYCSPGFILSGVELLDELSSPSRSDIQQAIAGNLCRCTGYYKIIEAIEKAALNQTST
jgi:carbon-monoxide dehydrogenase medium subunit